MGTVEVAVLGPLEVTVDGARVDLPGRRPAALLALLGLAGGRPVSIDELARGMWGDDLPGNVRGSVQTYVGRLRRVLGDEAIVTDRDGYRLAAPPVVVDLDRFVRLVAAAEEDGSAAGESLDAALALWRGEPLGGLSEWIDRNERPALIERYLCAVERRADHWLDSGDPGAAVLRLRPLVEQHRLRESTWARLLSGLRDSGRSAEALEMYETMRSLLADELGADPSPELRALHVDLLTGPEPAAPSDDRDGPTVPHELPRVGGRFVGRESQLARLDRVARTSAMDDHPSRLIVIDGAGGVGKSTLAVHWARQHKDEFPHGELFVRLNGYGPAAPVPPEAALETMLRSLGVAAVPATIEDRTTTMRTLMATRRMLVILDDARDADQVRPLLPGGESVVVITSRSQLRGVVAREGAVRVPLGPMTEEDAVALLAGRLDDAGALDESWTGGSDNAHLAELVDLCGRLPIAIVVAAERASRGDVALDDLARLLRDRRRAMATLATGDDTTTDIGAVFDWSYHALSDDAATLYRRLGALADVVFSKSVADALMGTVDHGVDKILDSLVDRHLISVVESGWYIVHDLVREHARGLAHRSGGEVELDEAVTRLHAWYVHTASAAEGVGSEPSVFRPSTAPPEGVISQSVADQRAAIDWFGRHRRGIEAVFAQAAATRDHATVYGLAVPMGWYYVRVGAFSERDLMIEIALLSAREAADPLATAVLLNQRGTGHGRQGRLEEAREAFIEARDIFVREGHRYGEYRVVSNLGQLHIALGEAQEAIELLERARAATTTFDAEEHLPIVSLLVQAYVAGDRLEDAVALGEDLADRWRSLGDLDGEATVLDCLGEVAVRRGRLDEAERLYRQASDIYAAIGDEYELAWSLAELGEAQAASGLEVKARSNLETALVILERIGASDVAELNRATIEATLAGLNRAEPAEAST